MRITELTAIIARRWIWQPMRMGLVTELGALGAVGGGLPATEVSGAAPFSIETLSVSGARLTYAPHGGDVVVSIR